MRKLRVFESISIDGYFCDAEGTVDFAHSARQDPKFAAWVGNNASSGGALLFGRKTYEMMEAYWPTPPAQKQMPETAKGMTASMKYVASRKKRKFSWDNTKQLEGDAVAAVRKLKQGKGPLIVVLGSGKLVEQLGAAGLVDEYQFVIIPVALGKGRTIFTGGSGLKLVEHRVFAGGQIAVTYETA